MSLPAQQSASFLLNTPSYIWQSLRTVLLCYYSTLSLLMNVNCQQINWTNVFLGTYYVPGPFPVAGDRVGTMTNKTIPIFRKLTFLIKDSPWQPLSLTLVGTSDCANTKVLAGVSHGFSKSTWGLNVADLSSENFGWSHQWVYIGGYKCLLLFCATLCHLGSKTLLLPFLSEACVRRSSPVSSCSNTIKYPFTLCRAPAQTSQLGSCA